MYFCVTAPLVKKKLNVWNNQRRESSGQSKETPGVRCDRANEDEVQLKMNKGENERGNWCDSLRLTKASFYTCTRISPFPSLLSGWWKARFPSCLQKWAMDPKISISPASLQQVEGIKRRNEGERYDCTLVSPFTKTKRVLWQPWSITLMEVKRGRSCSVDSVGGEIGLL